MRWLRILAVVIATALGTVCGMAGFGTAAAAAAPTVSVVQNTKLGAMLVGPNGMTLYRFTKDSAGVSNCSGGCATVWPALTVTGTPTAGTGVTGTLATIKRIDGSLQVTYNGWPLYYYAADQKAGDTNGQGVVNAWYVVAPAVAAATAATPASSSAPASPSNTPAASASTPAPSTTAAATTVSLVQNAKLGPILVGPNGKTLYRFLKDSADVSNCAGKCVSIWPPLSVAAGTPTAGAGVTGRLGTIKRADGSVQVTYNGWPLYYYAADQKPGDTNGQGILKAWYVMAPAVPVATAATTATAVQPTLPKTGAGPLPEAAGAVLLAFGAGLMLARRRRAA